MKINIQANNFELTDTIKDFVFSKFKLLTKILHGQNTECLVTLGLITKHRKQGEIYKVSVRAKNDKDIFQIEETHEDLYAAVDVAKDTIERAIVTGSEKKRSLFRRTAAKFKQLLKK
jgi:ribosomal subunit interface protein